MRYSCKLELKSFNIKEINSNIKLIKNFVKNFNFMEIKGPITTPIKKKKFVVLRSPHVHKKSREHFEIYNYKTILILNSKYLTLLLIVVNFIKSQLYLNFEYKQNLILKYKY